MALPLLLLLLTTASAWFMTGLIWFVQLVHYPQFDGVGAEGFAAYHRRHSQFTTWVVGPPMLVEAVTAAMLLIPRWRPAGVPEGILWMGAALVAVNWGSTALLQVPRHDRLGNGFDADVGRSLCTTNWIRTAAWSARAILMLIATGFAAASGRK